MDKGDINELRAFMQGAAMYQGAQAANGNFYGKLMSAQATNFMNYASISGISQSTANCYIEQGITAAAALSLNYGCSRPVVSADSAIRYAEDIYASRQSVNEKIYHIKENKRTEYENYIAYQEYLMELARWQRAEKMVQATYTKVMTAMGKAIEIMMSPFGEKPVYTPVVSNAGGNPRRQMSQSARAMQREEAGKFFSGMGGSIDGTLTGIAELVQTVVFIAIGDEQQKEEGWNTVNNVAEGIKTFVTHPIQTMKAMADYIEAVAEEKGGSYVFGYGLGLSFQSVLGGKAVKALYNATRVTKLKRVPTSGFVIKSDPKRTTTILGRYDDDIVYIIEELDYPKGTDFSGKKGGFNVLNTPNEYYITPDQFWNEYNKPFLDAAIERGDKIVMATKINRFTIKDDLGNFTGYGREYDYLLSHGYRLINGEMIK